MTRLLLVLLLVPPTLVGLALLFAYLTIAWNTSPLVFDELADVPKRPIGLVLGCTPRLRDGRPNAFFTHRMDAAAALWKAGKVDRLLLSGDNRDRRYDEPEYMRQALIERGVDEDAMSLDRAGLRTLDSVLRAKETFGEMDFVVVSQRFHNQRALFIAQHHGLNAVGFNAASVGPEQGQRTRVREAFARVKTLLDLFLLGTRPAELGNPEPPERP